MTSPLSIGSLHMEPSWQQQGSGGLDVTNRGSFAQILGTSVLVVRSKIWESTYKSSVMGTLEGVCCHENVKEARLWDPGLTPKRDKTPASNPLHNFSNGRKSS